MPQEEEQQDNDTKVEAEENQQQHQHNTEEGDDAKGQTSIPKAELDEYGLPVACERESSANILRCKHVVMNHISFAQYTGFVGDSFNEVQHVWRDLQIQWAGA